MSNEYRVTLDACVAGNPLKAWKVRLPAGQPLDLDPNDTAPDREPPDDVWEAQTHDFAELDAAKAFIRSLPEPTTTHVRLFADGTLIFDQDADAEHLDAAGDDVLLPHLVDSALPDEPEEIPEAPAVLPSQGA